MIRFERIDVRADYIDVHAVIETAGHLKNMYIESIIIDNEETYVSTGPSSKPVFRKDFDNFKDIHSEEFEGVSDDVRFKYITKNVNLRVSKSDLGSKNLLDQVFFVYIKVGGVPGKMLQCGEDKVYHMAVAYSKEVLYSEMIRLIPSDIDEPPAGAVDTYLRMKAVDTAFKAGNIMNGIEHWKNFFAKRGKEYKPLGCSCDESK